MQIRSNYRPDIDGLRAIAVIAVVLFHAFPAWWRGGFVGVDVFFVISGYLITNIVFKEVQARTFTFRNFYQRRAQRILPALIVVLIASVSWGWATLLSAEFQELARHIGAASIFSSNLLMYSEAGYFDRAVELKPLMHLWSLGVEEQFYLVWPLLLIGLFAITSDRYKLSKYAGVIMALSLVINIWQTVADQNAAFFLPFSRFWELLAGGILALYSITNLKWEKGNWVASLGLFLVIFSIIFTDAGKGFPGWWVIIPVVGAMMLIGTGPATWIHRVLLSNRVLVNIGLISYPLYLWHWVILSFIHIQADHPGWKLRTIGVIASFVLAWLTYELVEKRLRHSTKNIVILGLIGALGALGVASVAIFKFDMAVRTPTKLQRQLQQTYSTETAYRYKTCFLDPVTQGPQDFAEFCSGVYEGLELKTNGQRLVLLWGDSLAAQLYPGLRNLVDSEKLNLAIAQRTAGSCPPGMDLDQTKHGACDAINAATRKYIEQTRPYAVVINARWENGRAMDIRIPEIVKFLREQNVSRIVLIGPTPDWAPDLKKLLLRKYFHDDALPLRMSAPQPYWSITLERHRQLQSLALALGIDFLSPIDEFCVGQDCLLRVSEDIPAGLIASDHDHMTEQASLKFFQQNNVRKIIETVAR
jgi:peptidoglycan/LPS O-acetylase OafA/YrhL